MKLNSIADYKWESLTVIVFCVCENKGADQLCSDCVADQPLCFQYIDSTIQYIDSTTQLISSFYPSFVETPEGNFSPVMAQEVA